MATQKRTRLTDKFIRALKPPCTGSSLHLDAEVPGFGIRITSTGSRAFTLAYTVDGKTQRKTLAAWPEWTATAARTRALEYRRLASEGTDPFEKPEIVTLGDLARDYMEQHANIKKRAITAKKDHQMIDRHILPGLGADTPIRQITYKQVERLHTRMKDIPVHANRMVALLHKMFSLAIKWKDLEDNPCKGIEKFPEQPRERYLNKDELKRLVAELDAFEDRNIASAIALMMLTGCRKTEALTATWDQFDLEEGVWTKPSHHTKQKRTHRVPLNAAAVHLLEGLPHTDDAYLFPGRVEGQPLQDIKKAWEKLRQAAGVPDLRMHDLRHTYASLLASKNLSLPIIGQLLGHTQAQTTARYAHLLDEPLKDATDLVGDMIEGARS